MASPAADLGPSHQHHPVSDSAADSAFQEAQTWIEAVTGRCFGDKDFRGGLENGILLCELLSSIKPGSVKKINRLQTPIAGLDNVSVFLRGCEEFGLKGSQLFDPGDLQDTSARPTAKGTDCTRKVKNVLITIYWLGRAANGCTSYNGPTLDLKEFEGLLSQMRKEAEEAESPKRNIRDSGYIDCWDSERSDSLSPPRHCREDSFDSLDSFGSRSRQTPSPDVPVTHGSSDGRGSDSESDGPPHRKMPDVRKDDMSVRRTSVTELRTPLPFNQYLPNKSNHSGYMPTPLRKKMNDKDEGRKDEGRKSWSTATSPVGGDRPCSTPTRSCSEELFQHSTPLAAKDSASQDVITPEKNAPALQQEAGSVGTAVIGAKLVTGQEESLTSPQCTSTPSPSHFLPGSTGLATTAKSRQQGQAWSENEDPRGGASWTECSLRATVSCTLGVSDDAQSVSMIDMRAEEETILQPHSQVRHELMHNQYNKMKEEEDHWQDDLARWKNRRRSISQDLIKKEEERKMMEQLLSGDTCTSVRRRSIKTYREIVADKERREQELRDAYRRARTPEEASSVLQRYAQRFSISEAVLEQLQLPKLLDRSISADPTYPCSPFPLSVSPSSSPTTPDPFDADPEGPLRYLRQQSAPAPKFTSTYEARIEEFTKDSSQQRPQIRSRSSEPPTARGLSPKPVPLLMPKPYLQSRPPAAEQWPSKADGLLPINGEVVGVNTQTASPQSQGRESPHFLASPSKHWNNNAEPALSAASSTHSPHASIEGENQASAKTEETRTETTFVQHSSPPSRPTTLPSELHKTQESFTKTRSSSGAATKEENVKLADRHAPPSEAKQGQNENVSQHFANLDSSGVSTQPMTSQASVTASQRSEQDNHEVPSSAAPGRLGHHPAIEKTGEAQEHRGNQVSFPVLPQARQGDRWSWDPDEERKRQERWQQEQERMLQEKYQREQEKLKEEWEKAQREVAEEERKYHEEERRILAETLMPLTPCSSGVTTSSRGEASSPSEPQDTIVRSLADWERKQELLERQSRGSTENAEHKQRTNDRTSDISTADDSMKTGRSSLSQSPCLSDTLQNGQKAAPVSPKSSTDVKKQQPVMDNSKQMRPAGTRRIGPADSNNTGRSSSKPPASCPPPPDTVPPAPNRSVSGKKLCSSCGHPLGKGAAMIIETLSLYFHIHCFKCGVCKGQLGDTTTGTDVRIRNGLLNCHQCYIRSRSAGQPTTL
ncbi:LIM and calponin homology domains-containing protein 1 isoform X4 [Takifugu flavidus]|uniref:LIM and calponin homology domains-containing protein 1 isoform X4 n=1 Tax=Takifugu flavidus TaxID=433684 RepID=UPI0025449845|nr:LIM and calponin homology domains-containing protein 1 isoform X4 [Takifugu flavidus]